MRQTQVRQGEHLFSVAARTLAGSSYQGSTALAAYAQAIVTVNSQPRPSPSPFAAIVDWTALAPGQLLELPN